MRSPFIKILFVLMLALQFTSCVTTHQTNYMQPAKNFIPAYKDSISYQDYRLRKGDKLFIQVYSTDDKTNALFNGSGSQGMQMQMMSGSVSSDNLDLYTYMVQPNGCVQLPIIGDVKVLGKTIREAKHVLEESIQPLLKLNSVDVRMVGRSFSIIGSGKSGRFQFPREKVNIYQALAMTGDLGTFSDRSKIRILRETENGTQIKTFDLRSIDIMHSEFYYLEPNDVIFIQPLKQQFFGVATFWSAVSTITTTYAFCVIIYKSFF